MPKKVIIIGGVAAGPKAAAKIVRLNPEAEVTLLEKGKLISYAAAVCPTTYPGWSRSKRT